MNTPKRNLCTLATQPPCECKVLRLDGDTLCVDCGEVGVLKERDEVSLRRLLQGHDSRGLEAQVRLRAIKSATNVRLRSDEAHLEVLCDFTDESLEGQFADEKLG